jgi:hypothetical protein
LLVLLLAPLGNLLRDKGGVAASTVVDNEIHLDFAFYGLFPNLNDVLDHLRVPHVANHFVKREGLGIGFLAAHPQWSDEPDNHLFARIEKLCSRLGKLLPEGRRPGPMEKTNPTGWG